MSPKLRTHLIRRYRFSIWFTPELNLIDRERTLKLTRNAWTRGGSIRLVRGERTLDNAFADVFRDERLRRDAREKTDRFAKQLLRQNP